MGKRFDTRLYLRAWLLAGYRTVFPLQPCIRLEGGAAQSVAAREVVEGAQKRAAEA